MSSLTIFRTAVHNAGISVGRGPMMESRRRDERREPSHEIRRLEHHVGRSVAPALPQSTEHAAVGEERSSLGRDGRPRGVAAWAFEPPTVAGWAHTAGSAAPRAAGLR